MSDLHFDYRIGISTVSEIIRDVCEALWSTFKTKCFPPLTVELLEESDVEFVQWVNFPHCVAAIDGKHVRVIKPEGSASVNFNYKNFFSILLLAACDSNYKFLYIDVGTPEKSDDSTTLKNSRLNKMLQSNKIKLPPPRPLSEQRTDRVSQYVLIGDEGFGLSQFVLRPLKGNFWLLARKCSIIV